MGVVVIRRLAELGPGRVLAPERFDPRRRWRPGQGAVLGELVDIVGEACTPAALAPDARALVLDTTHAREGFVFAWHPLVAREAIGSAKRLLAPGDVIVSRLRPYLHQVAYVDAALFAILPGGNSVLASTEYYVLRGKGRFDAACLVPLFLSPPVQAALAAAQEGGHHPRVSRETIASLPLPAVLVARSHELGERVRQTAAELRAALGAGAALVKEVTALAADRRRRQ
ncbi:MAG: hypothetical protein JW751_30490 [Polyangiaceae bacterium]|nr:hypothetical protein [Polyangiaceae bacterium]